MYSYQNWIRYRNLFTWNVEDLDLLALADHSMNGYEKLAAMILDIDPELKESNIDPWDYTTMWGRHILLSATSWKVFLRDFPTSLINGTDLNWRGRLCGAEQRGREDHNFRDVTIDPGLPWPKICVARNLCPLRIFHDIKMRYEMMEFGWGPSMEAAWGECQLRCSFQIGKC